MDWDRIKHYPFTTYEAYLKLSELNRSVRMRPHPYIDVIYAIAAHDHKDINNCVPAVQYLTHYGRFSPAASAMRNERDTVFNTFGAWIKTAEACVIYDHCAKVVKNVHNGRKVAKAASIIISDSVALNHKCKKGAKSHPYTRAVVVREGLGWSNAYHCTAIPYSIEIVEVSIESGRKRESYVRETNRFRARMKLRYEGKHNPFPRCIILQSVVKEIYVEGEKRHVQTAISEKLNKSTGTATPALLELPPVGGRRTGNKYYNSCSIARPTNQPPANQEPRYGPPMRGSVSRDPGAGVSSDAARLQQTTVFFPDLPHNEGLEPEATVRWIYCGSDFVRENGQFHDRPTVDGMMQEWKVTLHFMKKGIPNFAVCLPPAGSYFENEEERENADYVNHVMTEYLNQSHILHIPMFAIWCPLNLWRYQQYHFTWDMYVDAAPALLWVEYDVSCSDYMALMSIPSTVHCAFQTCPCFKTEKFDAGSRNHYEHKPPQKVEEAVGTVTPIQRIIPVRRQLVIEQIPEVICEPFETAEIFHHAICLVHVESMLMKVVGNAKTNELYVSFSLPFIDLPIDPRVRFEMPSVQDLVRCKDMHPETHMTMETFHFVYADPIHAVGKKHFAMPRP